MNLTEYFMTNCDYKNNFFDKVIPKNFELLVQKEDTVQTDKCFAYRNHEDWLTYCKPVCSKLNM